MHRRGSWAACQAALLTLAVGSLIASGCGSGGSGGGAKSSAPPSSSSRPDFLTYSNPKAHYHLRYPRGWHVSTSIAGGAVRIGQPGEAILITTRPARKPPTVTAQRAVLAMQKKAGAILKVESQPRKVKLPSGPALRMVVTTKRPVPGQITRYLLYHSKVIVTLYMRSPLSVDARKTYAFVANSFGWGR